MRYWKRYIFLLITSLCLFLYIFGIDLLCINLSTKDQVIQPTDFPSQKSNNEDMLFEELKLRKYKKLIKKFDKRWKKYYGDPKNRFEDGFYLDPLEEIFFSKIDKTKYKNLPEDAAFAVEEFTGYRLVVSSDRKKIYLSKNIDFLEHSTVRIGEEISVIRDFYLEEITTESIKILMGNFKRNHKFCRSFLEMYRITKNEEYLEPARKILIYFIEHLDAEGRYFVAFPGSLPKYRALYQSYLVQLFDDYLRLSPREDEHIQSGLMKIGQGFYYTDEGHTNHWLEANIAIWILNRLGIKKVDLEKHTEDFLKELELLFEAIKKYNGKIIHTRLITDPPVFCSLNYQNYNTMLLAVISGKYLKKDMNLNLFFPLMFNVAKKEDSYRLLRGLYYAKLQIGFDDPAWVRKKEKLILKGDYSLNFIEIPTLIKYKILAKSREY